MDALFPPAVYIDHDTAFRDLVRQLSTEPLIAIDTESNSLYAYRERVCLVQISTRSADYIIDPLRIADMTPLGSLLADPKIEKVFHAAEYDLICMKRDYGFKATNLFDTMVTARIIGHKFIGLNRLLGEYLSVEADKSHQRDDWGQRPLTEEGLRYAQMDTHFLPELRDILLAQLDEKGLLTEARETLAEACDVPVIVNEFDPDGYWRIGTPADLSRRQMAILRELYLLRDRLARERDCPSFKVFNDQVMIAIAENAPTATNELHRIKGMSGQQVRRYGRQLLQAVERGRRSPTPHPPARPPDLDPDLVERFTVLREWRKLRAEQRGVESDVIISKEALWAVASKLPTTIEDLSDIEGLGPWRLSAYGEELVDKMKPFQDGAT
ncbi:MAG: HRDC domain-containing protein [Chloroflexota bacterium]